MTSCFLASMAASSEQGAMTLNSMMASPGRANWVVTNSNPCLKVSKLSEAPMMRVLPARASGFFIIADGIRTTGTVLCSEHQRATEPKSAITPAPWEAMTRRSASNAAALAANASPIAPALLSTLSLMISMVWLMPVNWRAGTNLVCIIRLASCSRRRKTSWERRLSAVELTLY